MKEAARGLGSPIYQPERIRSPESIELLRGLAMDFMVVVGYGQIIPQDIIDLPPHGILNVHASLLPKYRGAAPIQWAIANGESRNGRDDYADRCGPRYGGHAAESSLPIGRRRLRLSWARGSLPHRSGTAE